MIEAIIVICGEGKKEVGCITSCVGKLFGQVRQRHVLDKVFHLVVSDVVKGVIGVGGVIVQAVIERPESTPRRERRRGLPGSRS